MTTPSQNVNQTFVRPSYTVRQTYDKAMSTPTGVAQHFTSSHMENSLRKIRPESSTSEVRPDGTRAPKPWSHRWASLPIPWRNVEFFQTRDSWNYSIRVTGIQPIANVSFTSFANATGAGWSELSHIGFPYTSEAKARTRFLNKLQNGRADLGVALGEMRQTAGFIAAGANAFVSSMDKVQMKARNVPRRVLLEILNFGKVRPRRAGESRGSAARRIAQERKVLDLWLGYQFGLLPLLNDIEDAGNALSYALFDEGRPLRLTIKSGASESTSGSFVSQGSAWTPGMSTTVEFVRKDECHLSAVYDIPLSQTRSFTELGLTNPASVAWELVQWSWLVDYLTTTGKWINSFSGSKGTTFVEGCISRKQEARSERQVPAPQVSGSNIILPVTGFGPSTQKWVLGRFQRDLITPPGIFPAFRPALENRLNLRRVANALSALAQSSGRGR